MPLQCSTRQVDISRQLAGQQNLLRHIARWRRRFPLAAKATGSNPDGGKGAQGASTGLDLPRAQLERCDARRRRSTFSIVPWWPAPPGREPRQSWPLNSAAFAVASAPAKAADMPVPTRRVVSTYLLATTYLLTTDRAHCRKSLLLLLLLHCRAKMVLTYSPTHNLSVDHSPQVDNGRTSGA